MLAMHIDDYHQDVVTVTAGDAGDPDHHYRGTLLFHIRFKCADRPDWKCR